MISVMFPEANMNFKKTLSFTFYVLTKIHNFTNIAIGQRHQYYICGSLLLPQITCAYL